MTDQTQTTPTDAPEPAPAPQLHVAPGPHVIEGHLTTRRMMVDVLIALTPALIAAFWVFRFYAVIQVGISVASCLAAEALFTRMRRQPLPLGDYSAAVTGVILGLSLPSTAPWFVGAIGGFAAIGLGKTSFGGMGHNIFNPAMVGRAFIMIAFPALLGASAYVTVEGADILSGATPLTLFKQAGETTPLANLLLGNTNGSLGETSALACLIGGVYLCIRRTAAWQIPAGVVASVLVIGGLVNLGNLDASWGVVHHLLSGSMLFGAFFIATDPVSSPLTPKGRFIFGAGIGALVLLLRMLSGYPEGVMFAVLLMNAVVPLINRWSIPRPVGGPVPVRT